jgi:signal transduction histidine kinase
VRRSLRKQEVDVGAIAADCGKLLREEAHRGEINLRIEIPSGLPRISADQVRLKQVLLNLLSNAIKFTPAFGQVTLSVAHIEMAMTISVTDTGVGMHPEQIAVALEPFRQLDGSLSRQHEGAGLGLPLAKQLTELHGGVLEITSQPDEGTRVVLSIPR